MKSLILLFALTTVFFAGIPTSQSQSFLNGDFEKTTAPFGVDQINLSNAVFNTMMENTFAFGTYGDVDIINTPTYSGAAQHGSWFVALTGGGTDKITMELSSALIAGKSYSITFWDKAGAGFQPQPIQIGVSDLKDSLGTMVYKGDMPLLGQWTKRSFSFTAPLSGKYISVELGGINNLYDWAQVDNFTIASGKFDIRTENIALNNFCACGNISIPFTATGDFASDNVFTAQLSDASGNFDNPTNIGELKTNSLTGVIAAKIPCEAAASTRYRVRVTASGPNVTGGDNGNNITVNAVSSPVITIKAFPSNVVKERTSVTFRLDAGTNRSAITTYKWQVNGVDAGSEQSFTAMNLHDEDVVQLVVTVDNPCASSPKILSNEITMTVTTPMKPSVSIEAMGSTTLKKGEGLTFIATPENEGSDAHYQWKINGKNVGNNSSVFTARKLHDGDEVTVAMTTNTDGAGENTVVSNAVSVHIDMPQKDDIAIKEKSIKKNNPKDVGVVKFKSSSGRKSFGKRFLKHKSLFGMHHKKGNQNRFAMNK